MNLHSFRTLTETDRDNLADIAWFIKGHIQGGNFTFHEDHIKTIEHVMGALKNQISDELEAKKRLTKSGVPNNG